jgi:hypothetical protein
MRHACQFLSTVQQEGQFIPGVNKIWRARQAPPSGEVYLQFPDIQFSKIESDVEFCDDRCEVIGVEHVGVPQLRIVIGCLTENRVKRIKIADMKQRLQHRTPLIAVECFDDEVIGPRRRTHHGLVYPVRLRRQRAGV